MRLRKARWKPPTPDAAQGVNYSPCDCIRPAQAETKVPWRPGGIQVFLQQAVDVRWCHDQANNHTSPVHTTTRAALGGSSGWGLEQRESQDPPHFTWAVGCDASSPTQRHRCS